MKLKICLVGLLCLFFRPGAHAETTIAALKVGDKVPDLELSDIINAPVKSCKISEFKNKLLLLDFWATWCSSCINNFPKTYQLQQEFLGKLQVLLVDCKSTRDNSTNVSAFFEKRKGYYSFPCVVNDTLLGALFPHSSIPHYVWVRNNKVVAITDESQLTSENVRSLIRGNNNKVIEKNFVQFDADKPLFANGNGGTGENTIFRSVLAPFNYGLQSAVYFNQSANNLVTRVDVLNYPRMGLLRLAFPALTGCPPDRMLLMVDNKSAYALDSLSLNWKRQNDYCYEASFPACIKAIALKYMQTDLQRYFNIRVHSVMARHECFVLKVSNRHKIDVAKNVRPESNVRERTGPVYFTNYSVPEILQSLEREYQAPFLDETGFAGRVNLNLPPDIHQLKQLQESLKQQGFILKATNRKIRFYTISDGSKPQANH